MTLLIIKALNTSQLENNSIESINNSKLINVMVGRLLADASSTVAAAAVPAAGRERLRQRPERDLGWPPPVEASRAGGRQPAGAPSGRGGRAGPPGGRRQGEPGRRASRRQPARRAAVPNPWASGWQGRARERRPWRRVPVPVKELDG